MINAVLERCAGIDRQEVCRGVHHGRASGQRAKNGSPKVWHLSTGIGKPEQVATN
jgi:hypothetical protein